MRRKGDVSYIPTNVISITDGQIFLESDLFNSGIRPAVNVGISVSRVGGSAQIKAMKKVAGTLRLDLAQFRELAAFAAFGSDLDAATQKQLSRGERLVELLKQGQYQPMEVVDQVISIFAGTKGLFDSVPTDQIQAVEKSLLEYVNSSHSNLISEIKEKKEITSENQEKLTDIISKFVKEQTKKIGYFIWPILKT